MIEIALVFESVILLPSACAVTVVSTVTPPQEGVAAREPSQQHPGLLGPFRARPSPFSLHSRTLLFYSKAILAIQSRILT